MISQHALYHITWIIITQRHCSVTLEVYNVAANLCVVDYLSLHLYFYPKGAITKRMTAIEEMAGMDVLCSDKTGTLTLNRLTVDRNLIEVATKKRHTISI